MNRHSGSHLRSGGSPAQPTQPRSRNSFGMNGGMPIPAAAGMAGSGAERNQSAMAAPQGFDIARSPPSLPNKNTKHVPCKFFRQGACQAGNACPFLHTLDPMSQQAPCKYFMKGNCKFGAKCALAHYLPNGHRVSKADLDPALAMNNRPYGREDFAQQRSEMPINDSYLPSQGYANYFERQDMRTEMQYPPEYDSDAYNDRHYQSRNGHEFEGQIHSPPTSQFGSPPNEHQFPKSPVDNLRSALNAPLPASFDANSLPHIARYGPFGQSVPDKFGLGSPPNSTMSQKAGSPPTREAAFRGSNLGTNLKNASPLGASPVNFEGSIGERIMHSQRIMTKPQMSASVPVHDWDDGVGMESDLLPSGLHDEVLTPQEKMRRTSRPDHELSTSAKERSEGLAIPKRNSSLMGSQAGSPSRWRGLFEEQQRAKTSNTTAHVGSPLRDSWMPNEVSPSNRAGVQMSGISQAMATMDLTRTESADSNSAAKPMPMPIGLRGGMGRFDRTVSSPGLPSKKIDEENEPVFFPMDDESSRKGIPHSWIDQSGAISREKTSDEIPRNDRGLGLGNGVRPVFGFRP